MGGMSKIDREIQGRTGLRSDRVLFSRRVTDHLTGEIGHHGFALTGWRARLLVGVISFLGAVFVVWALIAMGVGSWVMLSEILRAA